MNRQRVRVGRSVFYYPTDAEATAGGGSAGDVWSAQIGHVLADGTCNLHVVQADGAELAVTSVPQGNAKGTFALHA